MPGLKKNARVVVVGAGPVGMVCALALNKRGVSVTVLEQEPAPVEDQRAATIETSQGRQELSRNEKGRPVTGPPFSCLGFAISSGSLMNLR